MRAIVGSKTCVLGGASCTGPECDLALLTVHDEAFWKGLKPISFGSLPFLQESVTVVGYPIGGENMSVTQGVVSRLDMQVGIPTAHPRVLQGKRCVPSGSITEMQDALSG